MLLLADYHTHTIYSTKKHAKGTILQNAVSGRDRGLKEIAITDHGFNHMVYGVKRKNLNKMREEVQLAKNITGINVLLGVEANFISLNGEIDILPEDMKKLDILLVGFHKLARPKTLKDWFKFFLPNIFGSEKNCSLQRRKSNTDVVLQAMDKYDIDVITHLGAKMPVNIEPIARKAVEKNVKIELNERRNCFTKQDMETMIDLGVKFVVDSDAHKPQNVGQVENVFNFLIKNKISVKSISNIDKIATFKKLRKIPPQKKEIIKEVK